MRVDELRKTLEQYDAATLKEIVVSLYKTIPKGKKEEIGVDALLLNFKEEKAKGQKRDLPVDFEALKKQIEKFISCAGSQYYLEPNRFVSKEQRSKWRFEVKRFIKTLAGIGGENSEEAARLLADVYAMLCYACDYYTFNTENPFSAVGHKQPELLRLVLGKIFLGGYSPQNIKTAVFLTLDSNTDYDTFHIELIYELIGLLKTPDAKELAAQHCAAFPKEYAVYQGAKEAFRYPRSDKYRQECHADYAVELYMLLKFSLHEYDDGIAYYWKIYQDSDQKKALYHLLELLDFEDLESLWLREYEKAVANGFVPNAEFQEEYAMKKAEQADGNNNGS